MVKDVVDVDSINTFVVKFEVKELALFLELTLINNMRWTKESVLSNIHNHIGKSVFCVENRYGFLSSVGYI
jgi:hypothetical protein